MRECRNRPAQSLEQLDLHRRVSHVIVATDHMRHAHVDVVDHGRQRVQKRAVFAHQHRVRQMLGLETGGTMGEIGPGDLGVVQLEAPMGLATLCLQFRAVCVGQGQRPSALDRWQLAREAQFARRVQFFRCLVGRIEPAR